MKTRAHLDFETRSEVDLKVSGLHRYARGTHTDILCAAFAFDKSPVELWKMGSRDPIDLLMHVQDGGEVVAHNAPFELAIWNDVGVKKYGWPILRPEQVYCTMAKAYAMALPGALENVAPALGIEAQKDMEGNRIMLQLSRPRKLLEDGTPAFWEPSEVPEKFDRLYKYCMQDVAVEREADERMLDLTPTERALWLLDFKINQRGVFIDTRAVQVAMEVVEFEKKRLDAEMREVTDNAVGTCSASGQLKNWLKVQGVNVEGVAKDVVKDYLKKELSPRVRKALELRQEAAKSSTAKLKQMLSKAGDDGRVRNTAQYHGAGTGRWAGRGIQVQNFPRPNMKQKDIEAVFALMSR